MWDVVVTTIGLGTGRQGWEMSSGQWAALASVPESNHESYEVIYRGGVSSFCPHGTGTGRR